MPSIMPGPSSPVAAQDLIILVLIPTVSRDVISLVANSCGCYRGQIEQHAAQEFTVHVVTQSGLAKRLPHRHPPRVQPMAPRRERPCRRPRLPPRRGTAQAPSRAQGHPGGAHVPVFHARGVPQCPALSRSGTPRWRTREEKRPHRLTIPRDAMPAHLSSFASWPWLLHTGCSLEALDMTVH